MNIYNKILARFPRGGVPYVFAYGSGVKQQIGYDKVGIQKNNVIDLVFCVKDPLGWHSENICRHSSHYSSLRFLGPSCIMRYQEKFGAGVYFNTLVPLQDIGVTIKYGVVSRDNLIEDLLLWRHLYLAGRLHKPVQEVVSPTDDEKIVQALHKNHLNAFQVSLLLLPERFTSFDLFHMISNLSYKGDFRMKFGENKHKVKNIVRAQENEFFELYKPVLRELTDYVGVDCKAEDLGTRQYIMLFEQDKSTKAKAHHLRQLPSELQKRLIHNVPFRGSFADIVQYLSTNDNLREILQASVNDIVWRSSITQSLKNIPSAGVLKSITYSYRKALKTFE